MTPTPNTVLPASMPANELQVSRDPPSLALPDYGVPKNNAEEQQQDSLKKADAQRIRAEIRRLELELESIESLDSE